MANSLTGTTPRSGHAWGVSASQRNALVHGKQRLPPQSWRNVLSSPQGPTLFASVML